VSVIRGENAILSWQVDGFFQPVACMESCNLTTTTEISETSTVGTGITRTYRGNRNSWKVSCQGVCSFDENHPHTKLRVLQQSMTPMPIMWQATDTVGNIETYSGLVIITSLSNDANASDFYLYQLEATGIGAYTVSDVPTDPNEACQDAWIYYTGIGTEKNVITIAGLVGKSIAGRLYRDGIEYRPSGTNHDGLGTPVGKQFKFEAALGRVTFDANMVGIAVNEPIDIPYNLCSAVVGCNIAATSVHVTFEDDNHFHITYTPMDNGAVSVPEGATVRYSTNGGATWTDASITYTPATNYSLIIVDDTLSGTGSYIFEVTPQCNGVSGTAGTGGYNACTAVGTITHSMPDAYAPVPYTDTITLTGTAPFTLTDIVKPAWLTIAVSGNNINFSGTPAVSDVGTGVAVSFTVHNCGSASTSFSDTIDVIDAEGNGTIHNNISSGSGILVEDVILVGYGVMTPYTTFPVAQSGSGTFSTPYGTASGTITVRFNTNSLPGSISMAITINGTLMENNTHAPAGIIINSTNTYTFHTGDVVVITIT
jgi:hypothetical protein